MMPLQRKISITQAVETDLKYELGLRPKYSYN
jgi:hypothetical protein